MTRNSATSVVLALLLGACALPAEHFGDVDAQLPAAPQRSFTIASDGEAPDAVRKALREVGYVESGDAPLRVEVGFAVRPRRLAVLTADAEAPAEVLSPAADRALTLCRRQAYVLTLAFVDRASGKITSRSGATISRCDGTADQVMPRLARAALPFG